MLITTFNRLCSVAGVSFFPLETFADDRGTTEELWRIDKNWFPHMGYMSWTYPGKVRGPHEHIRQTDYFIFPGPGNFELHLWSKELPSHDIFIVGEQTPGVVIIRPGVVHGYKNISDVPALVLNFPDQLYKGRDKQEDVDEIRWEKNLESPFKIS